MPVGYAGHQRMKYRAPELHLFKGCVCVYIKEKTHQPKTGDPCSMSLGVFW